MIYEKIVEYGILDRVSIISFDAETLLYIKEYAKK